MAGISKRLTMKEAADHLDRSYSWVWSNHISLGLNGYQIGGRWYFDLQDLIAWEAGLKRKQNSINNPGRDSNFRQPAVKFI